MKVALMLFALALGTGCASMSAAPADRGGGGRVTGTVTYVQRVALPPGAVVKVQLADVSRAGAPAIVLGEQLIAAGGRQPPFGFEIAYDPARIDSRFTYAVQARIEHEGKLLFITDRRYVVITRNAPNHVEMVLRAVGGPVSN